jgi:hypothetical protein
MIKNQKSFKIFGFLMIFCLLFSMLAPISVFGVTNTKYEWDDEKTEVIPYGVGDLTTTEVEEAIFYANQHSNAPKTDSEKDERNILYIRVSGGVEELIENADGKIKINERVWNDAKQKDVTKVMEKFIAGLIQTDADEQAIQDFMKEFQNADNNIAQVMIGISFSTVKADLYQAYVIMKPFLDLLNIVLGVGCVLLILILFASTVMDLAYIGLPVWREAQDGKGKKNPFGVSYEALRTVQDVEKGLGGGDGEYRNAYLLYFKRRALTYIILAICIMYLICGGISGIISFVLNLVGGIV